MILASLIIVAMTLLVTSPMIANPRKSTSESGPKNSTKEPKESETTPTAIESITDDAEKNEKSTESNGNKAKIRLKKILFLQ